MDGVAEEARWGVGDERSALKEQALKKVAAHHPLRDLSQTHDQSSRMKNVYVAPRDTVVSGPAAFNTAQPLPGL